MKLLFKAFCCAVAMTVIMSVLPFEASCEEIQKQVFRLHIIANSDSGEDQNLKLAVRDEILKLTEELYSSAGTKEEAVRLTRENLQQIANAAKQKVFDSGYDYEVSAQVTYDYFDTRTYESVTMPSGTYQTLKIIIGEGKGRNWWCVMYPSLCVGASTNYNALKENMDDGEYKLLTEEKRVYKFKIVEYYEKIRSFFF